MATWRSKRRVDGFVDNAHPAFPELFQNAVTGDVVHHCFHRVQTDKIQADKLSQNA